MPSSRWKCGVACGVASSLLRRTLFRGRDRTMKESLHRCEPKQSGVVMLWELALPRLHLLSLGPETGVEGARVVVIGSQWVTHPVRGHHPAFCTKPPQTLFGLVCRFSVAA